MKNLIFILLVFSTSSCSSLLSKSQVGKIERSNAVIECVIGILSTSVSDGGFESREYQTWGYENGVEMSSYISDSELSTRSVFSFGAQKRKKEYDGIAKGGSYVAISKYNVDIDYVMDVLYSKLNGIHYGKYVGTKEKRIKIVIDLNGTVISYNGKLLTLSHRYKKNQVPIDEINKERKSGNYDLLAQEKIAFLISEFEEDQLK